MAKMKVHELAKELEIESKVIVELLKGTEYEKLSDDKITEAVAMGYLRVVPQKDGSVKLVKPNISMNTHGGRYAK